MSTGNGEVASLKEKADKMALEIRKQFVLCSVYTKNNLPDCDEKALARKREIWTILKLVRSKLSEIKDEAKKLGIDKDILIMVRRSLTDISIALELESGILSEFLLPDSKKFLLSLVDEAVARGFQLTDDQAQHLEHIKAKKVQI